MPLSYLATCLADSPNTFWKLNETSGTFADSTANAQTATANGTITRSVDTGFSGVGKGVSFGGTTSDYISIPNNALIAPHPRGSYECWAKFSSFSSIQAMMTLAAQAAGSVDGLEFRVDTTGLLRAVANFAGTVLMTGTHALSSATWYHLVLTNDTGNLLSFYINGSLDTSSTIGASMPTTTNQFLLGINNNSATFLEPMGSGSALCCCAIYPTALSSTQVLAHYNARNNTGGGGGNPLKSPPGATVAEMVHLRNIERKLTGDTPHFPSRHPSEVLRRRRGRV